VGVGPTTGVTIIAGESAVCAWNGVDFIKTSSTIVNAAGSNTQVQFNNSGVLGASANLTWNGTSLTASNFVSAGNITINTNKFTVAGTTGDTLIGGTATVNSLTSGRVTFAGASGLLSDSASLTWDGTFLTAGSIKNSALTNTRITFAGASGLLSDSANLAWSGTALNVTGTVAVTGALTATLDSTFSSTGALLISKGTTGQRPSAASGMLRFNTTSNEFEGYNGTAWASVGGGATISNDTSTATDVFPLFANATSGTASSLFTGNAKLLYKPSTGEFQASVPVALNGIVVNSQTVGTSYTIAAGYSAMSAGPITLSGGVVVTVTSGSRWVVQ
jgi:hypothetical protein